MSKKDIRILRALALVGVLAAATMAGTLAAGPPGAWDARILSCVEPMFLVGLFVVYVGGTLTRWHR